MARDRKDNTYVTGTALRKILGIPLRDMKGKFKIDLGKIPDFDVFVQSTSYNRVLMPGTDFLYEADAAAPGIVGFHGIKKARYRCFQCRYMMKNTPHRSFWPRGCKRSSAIRSFLLLLWSQCSLLLSRPVT